MLTCDIWFHWMIEVWTMGPLNWMFGPYAVDFQPFEWTCAWVL